MGRHTKYKEDQHPIICEMLTRYGLTQRQIAKELGVALSTFKTWKSEYPAMGDAISKGKQSIKSQVENKREIK